MNTNSKVDQLANTAMRCANQGAVSPSTFLLTVGVSIALLGLAAGWLGHRPPMLVHEEAEATKTKAVSRVASTVQPRHMRYGEQVRNSQQLIVEIPATLKAEYAARDLMDNSNQLLRACFVQNLCLQSNCWLKAKAVAQQAQETVNRSRELRATGVISLKEFQASERDLDLAQSAERAARANVDMAEALCGEVERLDAVAEHAAQRIAQLETLVTELRLISGIDGEPRGQIFEQAKR